MQIVLRTCDRTSLQNNRIVNKKECILRCLNSILTQLKSSDHLHIIDDNSSNELQNILKSLESENISIDLLPARDQEGLNAKQKSRYSVKIAYDYIYTLNDLVYIVEDDYLHFPNSLEKIEQDFNYLESITPANMDVGIFPQDFNQLYFHPNNPFNETYVQPCLVVPTPNQYYRTTWYTQESFICRSHVFHKYKHHFDSLLTIGDNEYNWEGNTISNIWNDKEFKMFMPINSHVIHMSNKIDIPFFISKEQVIELWNQNKTIWSSEQDSQVLL